MSLYDRGVTTPFDSVNAGVIPEAVFGTAINWFVNRTPLISRLPKFPVSSPSFYVTNDNYRPRATVLTAANSDGTTATVTVADTSPFTIGDVIKIESETILVTGITSATVLAVTRGYASSTGASHTNGLPVYLVGKTGTGGDIEVDAISRVPQTVEQYLQIIQHPYRVGGALQATTGYVTGLGSPLDRDRMLAMQNCVDDFEGSSYYGAGVKVAASTTKPQMKGLQTLIVSNNTASPTNAAAYKPSDMTRDLIQKCFDGGGKPTSLIVSTDFLTAFAVWGHPLQRLEAGATKLGVAIETYEAPFLSGVNIVPAPLLRAGTAIALSGPEVNIRLRRQLFEKPRGSRGDAVEGDMIIDGAISLMNEAHHAWVEGITAYAAA